MTVAWYNCEDISEDKMWDSDKYWFKYIFQDRKFEIKLIFNSDNDLCDEINIKFVDNINVGI